MTDPMKDYQYECLVCRRPLRKMRIGSVTWIIDAVWGRIVSCPGCGQRVNEDRVRVRVEINDEK